MCLVREAFVGVMAIVMAIGVLFLLVLPAFFLFGNLIWAPAVLALPVVTLSAFLVYRAKRVLHSYGRTRRYILTGLSVVLLMIGFVSLVAWPSYRQLPFASYPKETSFACSDGNVGCPGATDYGWPWPFSLYSTFDPPVAEFGESHLDPFGALFTVSFVVICFWGLVLLLSMVGRKVGERR